MATLSNRNFRVLTRMASSAILACTAALHASAGAADEPAKAADAAEPAQATQSQSAAAAADPAALALRHALQTRYPRTKFGDITRTPAPGIWEVWMGQNVAYTTDEGRFFLFGHLFDMHTQTDLTARKKAAEATQQPTEGAVEHPKMSFADLPLEMAIKTVRGTGERKLAVFADPDCGYCRQLEGSLAKLRNVTVYTFLLSIREESAAKAVSIWCAKDRAAAWSTYMSTGRAPKPARCANPIQSVAELAQRAGVSGTPTIFFSNGDSVAGALDVMSLERRIAAN